MPYFMIGIQRSGSNLLRLMVDQLQEIAALHPPHILQRMMPLMELYGDLSDEAVFAQLVDDVCRLVELNPVPWEGVTFSREKVISLCKEPSLVAVYGAVYQLAAEAKGAKSWLCKSLANVTYLPEIERYFGKSAKYIYLYRDGRDVMLSFKKAVVGEKHAYHIAKEWGGAQRLALQHRDLIPDRTISISYEELTSDPESVLQRLCSFMQVEYSSRMLEFHKSSEAKKTANQSALWENVTKPVAVNSQKFLKEAHKKDLEIFESVAGFELDALGYQRVAIPKGQENHFSELEIARFDSENKRLKAEIISKTNEEDLRKRGLQEAILKEIKSRIIGGKQA